MATNNEVDMLRKILIGIIGIAFFSPYLIAFKLAKGYFPWEVT